MATILIAPFPERGHINPTLKIARQLRERGHRVVYCSLPDIEDVIRAEGFEFTPILEQVWPKGSYAETAARASRLSGPRLLLFAREFARRQTRTLQAMLEGELARPLQMLRPSLLLCDVLMPYPPVVAHGQGIPVLLMNTTIPMRRDPGEPPPSSPEIPDGRLLTRARITRDWWRISRRNWIDALKVRLGLTAPYRRYLARIARQYGFPPEALDFDGQSPAPRLPELVFCPREFIEFGRPRAGGQYLYVEPSIDLLRQEPGFPWERLPEGKPLIVFSLGSMVGIPPYRAEHNERYLRAALGAAERRPEWSFVLSTGRIQDLSVLKGAPPNLIAAAQLPQIQLLQRTTAMVTHGGFNSVKECIRFGVPMVVVPHFHDQPGIAARVVYHHLGEKLEPSQLSPEAVLTLLDKVSSMPSYRQALERMRTHFLEAEVNARCVDTIERFLGSKGRGAT